MSASTDFEPSVFASRCSSCARKSSRLPTAPPAARMRRTSATCVGQPREFLADVDLREEEREFLRDALGGGIDAGLAQPRVRLLDPGRLHGRQARRDARDLALDVVAAREQHGRELGAFARTRRREFAQHLADERGGARGERLAVDGRLDHHAGPAEDLGDRQRRRARHLPRHVGRGRRQGGHPVRVEGEAAAPAWVRA